MNKDSQGFSVGLNCQLKLFVRVGSLQLLKEIVINWLQLDIIMSLFLR